MKNKTKKMLKKLMAICMLAGILFTARQTAVNNIGISYTCEDEDTSIETTH